MASNTEKQRRRALAQAAERAKAPRFETTVGDDEWPCVLEELDRLILPSLTRCKQRIEKYTQVFREASFVLEAGTLLEPSAPEEEVLAAEAAWGLPLPPSYRSFLKVSNGLRLPAFGRLAPVNHVRPFPSAAPAEYRALLEALSGSTDCQDDEYFNYGKAQDSFAIRPRYAASALTITGPVPGGHLQSKEFGWGLLVREVTFDGGEHEVWEYDAWGSRRYRSFFEYFSALRVSIVESLASVT
jgi:hypothetical protein